MEQPNNLAQQPRKPINQPSSSFCRKTFHTLHLTHRDDDWWTLRSLLSPTDDWTHFPCSSSFFLAVTAPPLLDRFWRQLRTSIDVNTAVNRSCDRAFLSTSPSSTFPPDNSSPLPLGCRQSLLHRRHLRRAYLSIPAEPHHLLPPRARSCAQHSPADLSAVAAHSRASLSIGNIYPEPAPPSAPTMATFPGKPDLPSLPRGHEDDRHAFANLTVPPVCPRVPPILALDDL